MNIAIEMISATGPRVTFEADSTGGDIVAPFGFKVDWSSQVRLSTGEWRCPLVPMTSADHHDEMMAALGEGDAELGERHRAAAAALDGSGADDVPRGLTRQS